MRIIDIFSSISEKLYITVFISVFIFTSIFVFLLKGDTEKVNQNIISKQKELDSIVKLKDLYQAKKKLLEGDTGNKTGKTNISLTILEEIISKTFISGKLSMLKPSLAKEGKGQSSEAYEVKVGNATLGEIISFVNAVEEAGLFVKKLQLNMPAAGQSLIDVNAVLIKG